MRTQEQQEASRAGHESCHSGEHRDGQEHCRETRSWTEPQRSAASLRLIHIRYRMKPADIRRHLLDVRSQFLDRVDHLWDLEPLVVHRRVSISTLASSKSRAVSMSMLSSCVITKGIAGARKKPCARSRKSCVRIR